MATPAAILNLAVIANTAPANLALAGTQARLRATAMTSTRAGATMKKAFVGVGVAAGAAGVALFKVGEEFDSAYDKIRTRTGATGREMVKLKRSFRDVVSDVPADFNDAATAVGDLNTRLGLTGRPLERMSKQMTELSRITETDLSTNVEAVSKAFVDWEVKTKDQSKTLDGFFRLSQKSGLAVSDIAENVQKFGSPLRQLGFTLEESAAMFANFERAGVNTQTMVPGLKLAISNLTRPTETLGASMEKLGIQTGKPDKALRQVFDLMTSKGIPDIEKTGLAMDVFGKRAGADMAEAIKQGRFNVEEFLKLFPGADGAIRKTGRETMDLAEHWQRFANNLKLMVEPIAKDVFKGLSDLMKEVTRAFKQGGLEGVVDLLLRKFNEALPKIIDMGGKIAGALFRGFMDAPVWAQLAVGAWLLKGPVLGALGRSAGALIGTPMGLAIAATAGAAFAGAKLSNELVADPDAFLPMNVSKVAAQISEALGITLEKAQRVERFMKRNPGLSAVEAFEAMRKAAHEKFGAVRADIDRLSNTWGLSLKEIKQQTDRNMRQIANTLGTESARGKQAISDNFFAAMRAIENSMKSGQISANRGAKAIHRVLVKQLKSYGIKDVEGFINRHEAVTAPGAMGGKQKGGIMVPGSGSGDKVPAMLEPGEVVINREAVAAMGGAQKVNRINQTIPRFQKGGIPGGSFNVDGAKPGFVPFMNYLDSLFGPIYVMSGLRPGSITTSGNVSNHASGRAVDISTRGIEGASSAASLNATGPLAARMDKLHAFMSQHIPLSKVSGDFLWRTYTGGNHYNHIHRGITNGLAEDAQAMIRFLSGLPKGGNFAGAVPGNLKLPRFSSDFPLGALVAGGLNNTAAGIEKVMGDRLAKKAMTAGYGTGPTQAIPHGGGVLSKPELRGVMQRVGLPDIFGYIAEAESGRNPAAHNPSGASGLWQIMMPLHSALVARAGGDVFDPLTNAKVAKMLFSQSGTTPWDPSKGGWGSHVGQAYQKGGIAQRPGKGAQGLGELLNTIRTSGSGKDRHEALKNFSDKIKGIGLNEAQAKKLTDLRAEVLTATDYADRASQLAQTDDNGNLIPGSDVVNGLSEVQWVTKQLDALFRLRNRLIAAQEIIDKHRKRMSKLLEKARDHLQKIQKELRQGEKEKADLIKKIEDAKHSNEQSQKHAKAELEKELAKPPKKQDKELIARLREQIRQGGGVEGLREKLGKLVKEQKKRGFVEAALTGKIIPTITGQQSKLNTGRGDLLSELSTVQGDAAPMGILNNLPEVGVLGGDIFTAQMRLRELNAPAEPISDTDIGDNTAEQLALTQQLLREARLRTAVSEAHFATLSQTPFVGAFQKGGVALVGERGPELAHLPSGTRVHSASDTQGLMEQNVRVVIQDQRTRVFVNDQEVRAIVKDETRRQSRRANSGLPGVPT